MDLNFFKRQPTSESIKTAAHKVSAFAISLGTLCATTLTMPALAADNTANPTVRPVSRPNSSTKTFVPDQIIVMPKKGLDKEDLAQSIKDIDGKIVDKDMMGLAVLVEVPKGKLDEEITKAKKDKNFVGVQKNFTAVPNLTPNNFGTNPNDPGYSQQYYLGAMFIPQAWTLGATGAGVVYGSLDTGVDYRTNPDLEGRNTGLMNGIGYQAFQNLPNGAEEDLNFGHGTMTTNCFGASTNNNFGFAAPCFNSTYVPVSIAGAPDGEGGLLGTNDFAIARGIEFLMLNNVKLANLSYNSTALPGSFADKYWHPLLVALFGIYGGRGGEIFNSAGNSGLGDGFGTINPGQVVVSSVGATLQPSSFTVFGPATQFAAPGENIANTANGGIAFIASGTSFSSPLTAGVAGQVWSVNPGLPLSQVVQIMGATAQHPTGYSQLGIFYGFGVPNAAAAVRMAQTSF
ncbi:MAG TPA: S8 family serine peptidase [Oculatellaceae cyanobacterium]